MHRLGLYFISSLFLFSCTPVVAPSPESRPSAAESPVQEETVSDAVTLQMAVQSEPLEFTGQIDGTDILVALHIDAQSVTAYVCGGDETWGSVTGWLKGTLPEKPGEPLVLMGKNGRRMTVRVPEKYITAPPQAITAPPQAITAPPQALRPVDDALAKGTLSRELDEEAYALSLAFSSAEDASGLYRHQKDNQDVAVVVTNQGYATGVVMDNETKEPQAQTALAEPLTDKKCIAVEANGQTYTIPAQHDPNACE